MLSYCKKCGTVEVLYDKDEKVVVCATCDGHIENFTKQAINVLINQNKIKKQKPKAHTFKCKSCGILKQAVLQDGKIAGNDCDKKSCDFNLSKQMTQYLTESLSKEEK